MNKSKEISIKLVAIAKNEASYIAPWVFHHLRFGIDLIEIYINNTDDNSLRICKRIKKVEPRFNFIKADNLFRKSLKKKRSFQIMAYNRSLRNAKKSEAVLTHILILDLDEYLMQRNLRGNLKRFLQRTPPNSDIISFLWYSDDFRNSQNPFRENLDEQTTVFRMDHVKSIAKISPRIKSCSHHNFIFENDFSPKNIFSSLRSTQLRDGVNSTFNRSKLNQDFLDKLSQKSPEKWFVLHQIYRSETEYLASLCRGRRHNNDNTFIKVNRWGLQPYPYYHSKPLTISIKPDTLDSYKRDFQAFIKKAKIKKKIKNAHNHTFKTADNLIGIIKNDTSFATTHKKVFAGTLLETN